jgi:large subunit ribosomal protein L31
VSDRDCCDCEASRGSNETRHVTHVTCTCGNSFTTRSTAPNGVIHAEVCSNCHPFYTGKQKILDTGGRVARFEARYAKNKKK